MKLDPAGVAAGGHRPTSRRSGDDGSEGGATDVVHRAGPACRLEWSLRSGGQDLTLLDGCCTELPEVIMGVMLAGGGDGTVAELGQQMHRHAADSSGSPRDDDVLFPDAMVLECHDGEHRRVAGSAEDRRITRLHSTGKFDEPFGTNAGVGRESSPVTLAEAPSVLDHDLARCQVFRGRLDDASDQVDARNEWVVSPDDPPLSSDREPILVVETREEDLDSRVSLWKSLQIHLPHLRRHLLALRFDHQCSHHGFVPSVLGCEPR